MKYRKRLRDCVRKWKEFRASPRIYMKLQLLTIPLAGVGMCDYFATQGDNLLFGCHVSTLLPGQIGAVDGLKFALSLRFLLPRRQGLE